ncbi:MAG: hypothetical protein JW860_11770 [Sedimentisphaerales bacterium]|nr:hypothetical protein [Sedimentisphaerales bacterium]
MKQFSRVKTLSILVLFTLVFVLPCQLLAQAYLKVNKHLVEVSGPDGQGNVLVVGNAGSVETTSPARVELVHQFTKMKIPIILNEDGSFTASIPAAGGDKIRVSARNTEGKQSYGTFTVPVSTVPVPPVYNPLTRPAVAQVMAPAPSSSNIKSSLLMPPTAAGAEDDKDQDSIGLAVIITLVNTNTGEVVATQRLSGPTRARPDQEDLFNSVVENILAKCASVVKAEFDRRKISSPPETKAISPENNTDEDISSEYTTENSHAHGAQGLATTPISQTNIDSKMDTK